VLDKGEIKEMGTHDELLEKGGFYAKLHEMQFAKQVVKAWYWRWLFGNSFVKKYEKNPQTSVVKQDSSPYVRAFTSQ